MNNQIWFGASIHSGDRKFWVPDDYKLEAAGCGIDETGRKYIRVKGVRWFTNLDYKERHEDIILYKQYNPDEYPTYINCDAIEVGKTSDIPMDYDGKMGVPITFLDKYNPEQFEILGKSSDIADMTEIRKMDNVQGGGPRFYVQKNGVPTRMYERILIRRKK